MALLPDIPLTSPAPVALDHYLTTIDQALQHVAHGRGQIVLVSGEAGLGKSRLVAEAKKHALKQNMVLLEGACFELDQTTPYAPVLDQLRAVIRAFSLDQPNRQRSSNPQDWTNTALELHTHLSEPRLLHGQPDQVSHRYSRDLAQFFAQFAAIQPVIMVVEDLQWSDAGSLEYLLYLARMLDTAPILVLATYRSDEVPPELRHFLAELDRERLGTEILLKRLTRTQMDRMLRAILGVDRPLRPEFLDAVYALTGGNPYSVEEIVHSLGTVSDILQIEARCEHESVITLPVPRSILDTVQRRLSQVSPEAGHVLSLAAIFGNEFDFEFLRQLAEYDEASLIRLMKELVSTQLIVEESADRFVFRDTLTRQAVYMRLLARERRGLHKKLAEIIENSPQGAHRDYLGALAYHFFEAGSMERALVYSERAGQASLEQHKPRVAIDYLTRALEAARQLGAVPSPRLYHLRGKALGLLGRFERAVADFQVGAHIARQMGDREAEWQAVLDLGTIWLGRDYDHAGDYLARARQLAHEIGKPWMLAAALNQLGRWYMAVEQPLEALQCLHQSLKITEESKNPRATAETLEILGSISYAVGNLQEAQQYYERGLGLAYKLEDKQIEAAILPVLLSVHEPSYLHSGAPVSAKREIRTLPDAQQILKSAQALQDRLGEIRSGYVLAACAGGRGEYGRAFPMAEAALQNAQEIDHPEAQAAAHAVLGALHMDILALAEARRHLEQAVALARQAGSRQWARFSAGLLVSVCIAQGDTNQAETVLEDIPTAHPPAHTLGERSLECARTEMALAVGEAEEALDITSRIMEPVAAPFTGPVTYSPRLALLHGEALAMLRRADEAESMLHKALQAAQGQQAWPSVWRVRMALGHLRDTQGLRGEADTEYRSVLGVVADLSNTVPGEKLGKAFLSAASALVPRVHRTALRTVYRKEYGGLTAREIEVATLIGQGLSTQQIADTLMVGKRTIETHLSSILSKLGFSSRKQIATWATERDLGQQEAV